MRHWNIAEDVMKRSVFGLLILIALGLGVTFAASAVFSTQSVANSGAPQRGN